MDVSYKNYIILPWNEIVIVFLFMKLYNSNLLNFENLRKVSQSTIALFHFKMKYFVNEISNENGWTCIRTAHSSAFECISNHVCTTNRNIFIAIFLLRDFAFSLSWCNSKYKIIWKNLYQYWLVRRASISDSKLIT